MLLSNRTCCKRRRQFCLKVAHFYCITYSAAAYVCRCIIRASLAVLIFLVDCYDGLAQSVKVTSGVIFVCSINTLKILKYCVTWS